MQQHRIYIAGPYSADSLGAIQANVDRAMDAALECMRRGHAVHCPHSHTHLLAERNAFTLVFQEPSERSYERWLALDTTYIEHWATALLYIGTSPGANRELMMAAGMGLTIYRSIDEVPRVGYVPPSCLTMDKVSVSPGDWVATGGMRLRVGDDFLVPCCIPDGSGGWRDLHASECYSTVERENAARSIEEPS